MAVKLIYIWKAGMHSAIYEKQYSEEASNEKVLTRLIGLEAKIKS